MTLHIGSIQIIDTFAEAFGMRYARLIVTAADEEWLRAAVVELTGYSSSVIGCDAEAGVERYLLPAETPDGRPGVAALLFAFNTEGLGKAVVNRVGQCILTCPTTAVFNGLPDAAEWVPLGQTLRFFGDGHQQMKQVGGRRYWRIPVMDGEFLVEQQAGAAKGVAGGNIILQAVDQSAGLAAAGRAAAAVRGMPDVITPFPGGVVRSGSKVGSRYKGLVASTNDAFCPTLRGRVETQLVDGVNCCYEIVINGTDEQAVAGAMRASLHAAAGDGVLAIGAGNYGGKLGKYHIQLRDLVG